jgi:hypothetical protein
MTTIPTEPEITKPPYAVRPYQDDPNVDAFEIVATTGHIIGLGPVVVALVGEYEDGNLIPHVTPEIRTKLQADSDFITQACNAYQTALTTLQQIANYGDLSKSNVQDHPLRPLMVQLSSEDCAELARTALETIKPLPTTTTTQPVQPELESDEPNSYRVEIDRCPLYLSIEATSGDRAIASAVALVNELTKTDTEGIHLPLSEPGDHDADAIIYPSLDVKDYRIADVESM